MAPHARSGGPAPGWTSPEFARVAALLHAEAGLVFPPNRLPAAETGLRRVMERAGLRDPAALRAAAEARGAVLDAVIGELTIGETYFFREPRQLDFVRDTVLPAAAERLGPGRALRMWSAGCASGEEPYSLAILLREAGWRRPAYILGTDLAAARLAAARRGRYTKWAFRGVPEAVIERHFEAERRHWVLDPAVRAMVEFRVLNLAEDAYPSAASGAFDMDVILCRNVLIYFDPPTVARVAARLLASLADDGWLVLASSDPMLTDVVPCEAVLTEAGIAYRRVRAKGAREVGVGLPALVPPAAAQPAPARVAPVREAPVQPPPGAREPTPAAPEPRVGPRDPADAATARDALADARRAYDAQDYERAAALAADAVRTSADEAASALHVRALAHAGRAAEAGAVCASALDRHRTSAELTYLHATLLAQVGRWADAAAAARRALYLDRRLAVAHLLLGEALARTGDRDGAGRAFRNAEALLAPLAPEAPVPAADGEPAARLASLARARYATLAGRAA